MPSTSKIKGSTFEREIAKYLSKLYNESFIRVPNSGAFIGGVNTGRKEFLHEGQVRSFKGDIIPGQSFQLLNIECKNYGNFSFHQLLTSSKVLDNWLNQLMEVSDNDDLNVLFMKFNRKGRYIAVEMQHTWQLTNHFIYQNNTHGTWVISELEHFFKLNSGLFKTLSQTKN